METYYITLPELEILVRILQILVGLVVIPRLVSLITGLIPFLGGE